jgi:ribosomal protein S18 acetylase RimI-like enzyme
MLVGPTTFAGSGSTIINLRTGPGPVWRWSSLVTFALIEARTRSVEPTWGFSSSLVGSMIDVREPPDTFSVVVGYDGSDAARRALARVRHLAARQLEVLVVAIEPEVRSVGLGSELTDQAVATGRLLEEARVLLGGEKGIVIETRAAIGDPAAVLIDAAASRAPIW